MDRQSPFTCFFCGERATSIGYYSKGYPNINRSTVENPTLCCNTCFNSPKIMDQINPHRGGEEGIYRFLFISLGKMNTKEIGFLTGRKNYEINHLSSRVWRKIVFNIHYLSLPPKERKVICSSATSTDPVNP